MMIWFTEIVRQVTNESDAVLSFTYSSDKFLR